MIYTVVRGMLAVIVKERERGVHTYVSFSPDNTVLESDDVDGASRKRRKRLDM